APEGSRMEVSVESCRPGTKVIVRDFGPGVPTGALSSIFEPFFRVEGDRSRESGGVGLGLAIAHRAVGIHGGDITARNAQPGLAVEVALPGGRGWWSPPPGRMAVAAAITRRSRPTGGRP